MYRRFLISVWYEPTDVVIAVKIFETDGPWQDVLHFISPNRNELLTIARHFGLLTPTCADVINLENVEAVVKKLVEYVPVVISTLGSEGAMIARKALETDPFYGKDGRLITNSSVKTRLYGPDSQVSQNLEKTANVSGCGDCLTAGILYGIHKNLNEADSFSIALKAAALSLASVYAVPSSLSTLRGTDES